MPITRVIINPEEFFELVRYDSNELTATSPANIYPNRSEEFIKRLIFGGDGSGSSGTLTTTSTTTTTTTTIQDIDVSIEWNDITNSIIEYTLRFYQQGILKRTEQFSNPTGDEVNPITLPAGTYDITVNVVTVGNNKNFRLHTIGVSPNIDVNFHQTYVNSFFSELIFTTCQFILDETGAFTTTTTTSTTTTTTSSSTTTTTIAPTTTTTSTTTTTTSTVAGITAHLSMTNILHDRPILGYQLFTALDVIVESATFGSNTDGTYIISNFTLPFKIKLVLLDTALIQAQGHYNLKIYKNFIITPGELILDENILLGYDGILSSDLSDVSNTRNITIVINQIDDIAPTTTTTTVATTTTTSTTTTTTTLAPTTTTTTTTVEPTTTTSTTTTTTTTSTTTTTTTTIVGDFNFMSEIDGNTSDVVEVFINFELP